MIPDSAVGFFLVRAWREEGRLYARVRHSHDPSEPESEYLTTDPEQLIHRLRTWLGQLDGTQAPPPRYHAGPA